MGGMHARALALAAVGLLVVSACRLNPAYDEASTGASGSSAGSDTDGDSGPDPTGTGGDTGQTGTGGATGGDGSTSNDDDGSSGGDDNSSAGSSSSTQSDGSSSEGICDDPPDFPDPVGPYEELTIANAQLDQSGEPWLAVEPGQTVELRFDFETSICSCPNCIVQGLVGYVEHDWRDCFYNGLPGCEGVQEQAVLTFQAPQEPGEYTLSFDRTLEYSCEPDIAVLPPERSFAGVCVEG